MPALLVGRLDPPNSTPRALASPLSPALDAIKITRPAHSYSTDVRAVSLTPPQDKSSERPD